MRSPTALLILLTRVSFVVLGPGIASMTAATAAPVTVQFVNPGKFTDFQVRGRDANYTASLFGGNVKDELTPLMKQKYPNCSLLLRFTDIDLAGRYTAARNARVMTATHPARMSFDFLLTDGSGKVLAKGSTRLTDNSNPSSGRYDPRRSQLFYYERRVLNRWLRTLSTSR